jgi:hypothetical protein
MSNVYDTACRQYKKESVLPGWIVGTAGAVRYRLPKDTGTGVAQTDVYGYLLGTVADDGTINFTFKQVSPDDVPKSVIDRHTPAFVNKCFTSNHRMTAVEGPAEPPNCP